ncbi:MAG TPA: hypothetical protein VF610_00280, partial [Segetibacter sp.]
LFCLPAFVLQELWLCHSLVLADLHGAIVGATTNLFPASGEVRKTRGVKKRKAVGKKYGIN